MDIEKEHRLLLRLTFESDWHVGEGAGQRGHIDRLTRRMHVAGLPGGLPYVPAKTLTGILRDACEQVACGLDAGGTPAWQPWVRFLFGGLDYQPDIDIGRRSARPSRMVPPARAWLAVRAAVFPTDLRALLREHVALAESLTFVKPGVSIDPASGHAREDHLRFDEVVRAGALLEARAMLGPLQPEQRDVALALLWAGCRVARRLGGKRRRGLGQVTIELRRADPLNSQGPTGGAAAVDWRIPEQKRAISILSKDPPTPPAQPSFEERRFQVPAAEPAAQWHVVDLTVEARSPLVALKETVGNVVFSLDHIPGGYLLGALNGHLRKLLGHDRAFAAVARGDVCLLNAYPEVGGQRGHPVPIAFHYEKERGGLDKAGGVYNHLVCEQPDRPQLKPHREGFVNTAGQKGERPLYRKTDMQAVTHGTIDDRYQRPTTDVGGVFTFEAIRMGTVLRSQLRIKAGLVPRVLTRWLEGIEGEYGVGKAKKDDYGHVHISASLQTDHNPVELAGASPDQLTVWLVSDLLLRDARLRPSTGLKVLRLTLERVLGVALDIDNEGGGTPAFLRTRRTDGWHVPWGLPRPSYVGLAAGSCIRFKVTEGQLDPRRLIEVQAAGLGERRAEGFGEVILNAAILGVPEWSGASAMETGLGEGGSEGVGEASAGLDEASEQYVQTLRLAAWREGLREAALRLAYDSESRQQRLGWTTRPPRPENSQLGTLRALAAGLRAHEDVKMLRDWLDHLQETPARKEKWPERSLAVLATLLGEGRQIWAWIRPEEGRLFPVRNAQERDRLKAELWPEALRAVLLAAVRAETRDREGHRQNMEA